MSKTPTKQRAVKPVNLRVTAETRRLFEAILERDGVPFNAQVERAMKMWAESKGIVGPGGRAGRDG